MKIAKLKRSAINILMLITLVTVNAAQPKNNGRIKSIEPDFAYPQQVTKQSETNLKKALKESDSKMIIRSFIDLALAQGAIGNENIPAVYKRIQETIATEKNPVTKSLLNLLAARICSDAYNLNKRKYDERQLPLNPLPDDWTEWSGKQFQNEITQMLDNAISNPTILQNESLKEYSSLIKHNDQTFIYYPTLFDFAGYQYINILESLDNSPACLSVRLLVDGAEFIRSSKYVHNNPQVKKILDMYAKLMDFNSQRYAPEIHYNLERLDFIESNIYNSQRDDAEKRYIELLEKFYRQYCNLTEYSGEILIEILNKNANASSNKIAELYAMTEDFIKRYPTFWGINNLKNKLEQYQTPSLSVSFDDVSSPGTVMKFKIRGKNVSSGKLKIYRIPDELATEGNYTKISPSKCKQIGVYSFTFNGKIPFYNDTTIMVTIPDFGVYYPIVESDQTNKQVSRQSYSCFRVTNLRGASICFDNMLLISTDIVSGQPISDVEFTAKEKTYSENRTTSLGKSNDKGLLNVENKELQDYNYINIYPTKGKDIWSSGFYSGKPGVKDKSRQYSFELFTDLPIYHPGDTVNWSAVVYGCDFNGDNPKPSANRKITVCWQSANYQPLDTLSLVTDKYGRIDGKFIAPKGDLTGYYSIIFNITDLSKNEIVRTKQFSVMVSDYKMPTFFITMDKPLMNSPIKDAATLRGTVTTYSGVVLANTTVKLNLSAGQRVYWRTNDMTEFYSDSTTTDSEGKFSFELPTDLFENSPAPDGQYKALVSATSPSGESQQQVQMFMRAGTYTLQASLSDNSTSANVITPVEISITVTDASQKKQDLPVRLTITHSGDTVMTQNIVPGTNSIDLSSLPTGQYDFTFTLENESANTVTIENVAIYRTNDNISPSLLPLWINLEETTVKLGKDKTKEIIYAVPSDNSHIFYAIFADNKLIEQKWLNCNAGVHTMKLSIPDGHNKAYVALYSSRNYVSSEYIITLEQADPAEELKIVRESFRNNLIPGANESWRFRTVDGNGLPKSAALIMGMSNFALNAINDKTWPQSLNYGYYNVSPHFNLTNYYNNGIWNANFNSKRNILTTPTLVNPKFNTYGRSFFNTNRYVRGTIMMKNTEFMDAEEVLSDVVVTGAGHTENKTLAYSTSVGVNSELPSTGTGTAKQGLPEFTYRQGQTALAFFQSKLLTDEKGILTLSFNVPNENTTWLLQGLAYNDKLATASLSQLVTANKPVMVTPNLPRFVRANDIVDLSALVLNNTDTLQQITTTIEIFNPLNNSVICSSDTVTKIAPNQSATALIRISVPSELTGIGYRVKSSTEYIADGEQNLIPILPVITPVIETEPFYITPDSLHFAMKLPKIGTNASVTLEYCDNPLWYVVTALPGLRNSDITTAQSAADAIFSAAVAEGLLRDNPTIAEALSQWTESDRSDSTLVSMLQKNSDLKTMLLQATPWVADAMSDTERMQRLALLFDPKEIESVYTQSISTLEKLQRSGGGWAWMEQSDSPSEWATSSALYIFGCLNRLGYLPCDKKLNEMITSALIWHQNETEKEFQHYPDQSFYSFLQIRDLWPSVKPSQTGQKIIRREIQKIVKNWESLDIANKSACAMILDHNGYSKLAHTILQSVNEFAETSSTKGMWWPSVGDSYGGQLLQLRIASTALMAYSQLMPESKNIDMIRQWLILQRQTQNWGVGSMPSEIITALLTTANTWIKPAGNVDIMIGESQINTKYSDSYTGNMRVNISQFNPSEARLDISRTSHTPAWGAVFIKSDMKMTEVARAECEDLSIEKRIYKQTDNQWEEVKEFQEGERVKVQLLIHAGRDMQYVAITDDRSACFEPVEQLPQPIYSENICFYRENNDASTNIFVTNLPRGTYMLSYELWVNNSGIFSSGVATIQSQYAPSLSAHSSGTILTVKSK